MLAPFCSFSSHVQLHLGVSQPFLTLPFPKHAKWVDKVWLTSVWQFLHQTSVVADIEHSWTPSLPRLHDRFLMEVALEFKFDHKQLAQINSCWLYLQVLTIADISSADDCTLLTSALAGTRDTTCSSSYVWPNYGMLSSLMWSTWRLFLHYISRGKVLLQPLGPWISTHHQNWSWFQSLSSADVFYHHSTNDTYPNAFSISSNSP